MPISPLFVRSAARGLLAILLAVTPALAQDHAPTPAPGAKAAAPAGTSAQTHDEKPAAKAADSHEAPKPSAKAADSHEAPKPKAKPATAASSRRKSNDDAASHGTADGTTDPAPRAARTAPASRTRQGAAKARTARAAAEDDTHEADGEPADGHAEAPVARRGSARPERPTVVASRTRSRAASSAAGRAESPRARRARAAAVDEHGDEAATDDTSHEPPRRTPASTRAARRSTPAPVPVEQVAEAVATAAERHQHASPLHNQPASATAARPSGVVSRARPPVSRPRPSAPAVVVPRVGVAWPTRAVEIAWPQAPDRVALSWPAAEAPAESVTLRWVDIVRSELSRGAAAVSR